jgi:hypothetical protein
MHQYNVGAPFERISIDVAGPFPQSDHGNRYLLIAMDYFTKWQEVYAVPNQEATTIADALVTNFFCRFGIPRELHRRERMQRLENSRRKKRRPITEDITSRDHRGKEW